MIRIKSVSIQNFLSYGAVPTIIDLDTGGTTLIVGEDLDNTASGTGANGVGKTVWLNALIYGLYGKPISNISMDNLVNNINNKHLEVIVEFWKDDKIYTVKRVRKEKGLGNYAKVYCRGMEELLDMSSTKHDVTPDSVGNINAFVETALGIPYELFVRIVAFSATHTPFLDLPVRHASQANQSDIMEELFRLNRLSEKSDLLKIEIKDTKQSLDIQQRHNEQLEIEHERHNKQLESAEQRVDKWEIQHSFDIDEQRGKLSGLSVKDLDKQLELFSSWNEQEDKKTDIEDKISDCKTNKHTNTVDLHGANQELNLLENNNKNIKEKFEQWNIDNAKDIEDCETALTEIVPRETLAAQDGLHKSLAANADDRVVLVQENKQVDEKIRLLIKVIDDNEKELSHLLDAKCPYCLQKYDNTKTKIAACKAEMSDANEKLKQANDTKVAYDEAFIEIDKEIAALRAGIEYQPEEIAAAIDLRTNLLAAIEDAKGATNPHAVQEDAIDDTRLYEIQKKIERYQKAIDKENKTCGLLETKLTNINKKIKRIIDKIEYKSIDLIYDAKSQIEIIENKITELESAENPHQSAWAELATIEIEAINMDNINRLDKLLTHQNYLQKLLTKKDSFIRKNLLSKNLIFLNQRLKGYLTDLGLPHRVEFTQEMTAKISQFGRELDFGNLSSGQKARVNLALSFSFRDVLQRSLDSVNVCMLDEVLDVGLDGVGVQNAARMLKRKSREDELTLFIISHRDEVSGIFDKKLVVQMSKGFSNIKLED